MVFVCGNLVEFKSRKQSTTALSSPDAEIRACCETALLVCGVFQYLLWVLTAGGTGLRIRLPMDVYTDSDGATAYATSDFGVKRSRWVEMRNQWLRDMEDRELIRVNWCDKSRMKADICTKFQDRATLENNVKLLPFDDS